MPLQLSQTQATPAIGANGRLTVGKLKTSLGNRASATERQSLNQTALQPGIPARKLLLIEDMPHYADVHQRQRLADLLGEPVVVIKLDAYKTVKAAHDMLM